jgi:hypothetical protein
MHRHHKPPRGQKFSIGLVNDAGDLCGVIMMGRPVSRHEDDGLTIEANRLCTDGTKNACSMLYRAGWRAAKAMGYERMITYTLPNEGGASLRASGFVQMPDTSGGEWSRDGRQRELAEFACPKSKWCIVSVKPGEYKA